VKEIETPRPVTWKTRLLAWLATVVVRAIMATVRLRVEGEERCLAAAREHGGALFVTWHGRVLIPLAHFRGRQGYSMLVSLSRDGDFVTEFLRRMGLGVIRGSTKRRGIAAAREVLAHLERGEFVNLTPDGPRGPARIVQPGVIYMAQRSGLPIFFCGISAWPRWEFKSWDQHQVPKPFARASFLCGGPVFVSQDESIEAAARRLGDAINALEAQAEREVVPASRRAAAEKLALAKEEEVLVQTSPAEPFDPGGR
jgi:lysophospholipid acyltransferase (LPLAT)-like uncharacterized protein